jgi:hypothetical protein
MIRLNAQVRTGPRGSTPPAAAPASVPSQVIEVHAIIDAGPHGLAAAADYYKTRNVEPSLNGIDLRVASMDVIDGSGPVGLIDFSKVMGHILFNRRAKKRDNFLLVAHGNVNVSTPSEGLIMLMGGPATHSATGPNLKKISLFALDRKEGEALLANKALAAQQKLDAWVAFFRKLERHELVPRGSGQKLDTDIKKQVQQIQASNLSAAEKAAQMNQLVQRVEGQIYVPWRDGIDNGGVFGMSRKELGEFIALRDEVRKEKLPRLEIRACDLGQNPTAMRQLGQFLGVQTIAAPDVETLYSGGAIPGGPTAGGPLTRGLPGVNLVRRLPRADNATRVFSGEGFAIRIVETGPFTFSYVFTLSALTPDSVRRWTTNFLGAAQSVDPRGIGTLRVAAFNTRQRRGNPFLFPQEGAYRAHVKAFKIDLSKLDDWDF